MAATIPLMDRVAVDVVVVGAGAAGLMAARELARAGKKVCVLEARDRIGGRIFPLPEEDFGYGAQGGAEFVHGQAPITRALIAEAGLSTEHKVQWWDVRQGEPTLIDERHATDPLVLWKPQLLVRLKELAVDVTVATFLSLYFEAEEYSTLRDVVRKRVESYDAADVGRASAFALRDELQNTAGSYEMSLKEGYGKLLAFLQSELNERGVMTVLGARVKLIDSTGQSIEVLCSDGRTFCATQCVVTVPLPLISTIEYKPAIPNKIAAAQDIGYGAALKILIRFKTAWWHSVRGTQFEKMFFMFSNEAISSWWTQYPEGRTTLTGWVAGPRARDLAAKSDTELIELAITSLSNIFDVSTEQLRSDILVYKVNNWHSDPYAQGCYSYTTPETASAIVELRKSERGMLYFAGEAIYDGEVAGTVEGAFVSGLNVARDILSN